MGLLQRYISETRLDIARNRGNSKSLVLVLAYRTANMLYCAGRSHPAITPLSLAALASYKLGIEWTLGSELPAQTVVGPGLRVFHGQGLVVNRNTVIG